MASLPLLLKQKSLPLGLLSRRFLSPNLNGVATITSKALRDPDPDKPKPWPYEEKGYTNWHYYIDTTLKRLDENSKLIVVEGPVACGKSDLAQAIAKELDFKHFKMADMDLTYINPYGYDLRQLDDKIPKSLRSYDEKNFIKAPNDYRACAFQLHMFLLKCSLYIDAVAHILNTGQGVVMERSPYSDFVFAEAMRKCNYIDKRELEVIYQQRKFGLTDLLKPHLVIYLDTPVSVTLENLKKRGQGEEKTLTKEFLETMEEVHKLEYLKDIEEHAELLVYDWSEKGDPEVVVEDIERVDLECYVEPNDPKMRDWRFRNEDHSCEIRWMFTHMKIMLLLQHKVESRVSDVPNLFPDPEDKVVWQKVWDSAPGNEYELGYNKRMGDKNIHLKSRPPSLLSGKLQFW